MRGKALKRQARIAQSMDEAKRLQYEIRKWDVNSVANGKNSSPSRMTLKSAGTF